uniref:uncharacterized protein LOC131104179 isoform X2 n=1 Tax=Doryrhamphus excisus TaxID=161450 RepID=UPI0025ADE3B7|nr:uncharacterized protein LOC131104179 isoform X2 [Doryrhamphus excisus]
MMKSNLRIRRSDDTVRTGSPSSLVSHSPRCPSSQAAMADGRQPEEHWASNGQENGENGYSAYSYRENGYHGGAAAHPGTTVDDSDNLPPSPPPSPSAEQIGPAAQAQPEENVGMESCESARQEAEEATQSIPDVGAELKAACDTFMKASKTYFEFGAASETEISGGAVPHGIAKAIGQNSRTFSESLCPVAKDLDASEERCSPVLPSTDIIITLAEKDILHHLHSDQHGSQQSGTSWEPLDLAGVLPHTSLQKRELGSVRRKSVPTNVAALVGRSLAELTLGTSSLVGDQRRKQGLGYSVTEYSGPMPSPDDKPSPGDASSPSFLMLGASEVEGGQKCQPGHEECNHGKVPPGAKILERAVTTGIKPDRLRIPMTTPKDRLIELRLQSGLPADMKIQPIPEVDIERDSSREASPVPPDMSFIFMSTETGSHPETPPRNPDLTSQGTPSTGEKTKDVSDEIEAKSKSSEVNRRPKTKDKKLPGDHKTTARSRRREKEEIPKALKPSDGKCTFYLQEDTPKPQLPSPIIIIPPTQVEEDDDIEIAEEPREIMDDADIHMIPKVDPADPGMLKVDRSSTGQPDSASPSPPQQPPGNEEAMVGPDVDVEVREEKKAGMEDNRSVSLGQKVDATSSAVYEDATVDVSDCSWIYSKGTHHSHLVTWSGTSKVEHNLFGDPVFESVDSSKCKYGNLSFILFIGDIRHREFPSK